MNNISHKYEKLKSHLYLEANYINDKIDSLILSREYNFNGKKELFQILYSSNEDSKLLKEIHSIGGKIKKTYKCDTNISPTMDEVYKYVHGEKIR